MIFLFQSAFEKLREGVRNAFMWCCSVPTLSEEEWPFGLHGAVQVFVVGWFLLASQMGVCRKSFLRHKFVSYCGYMMLHVVSVWFCCCSGPLKIAGDLAV